MNLILPIKRSYMFQNKIVMILSLMLAITACKKKEIPVTSFGTPVFYFKGDIDGNATSLNAGVNNYYMHTNYTLDNSIILFKGLLSPCDDACSNSLEIILADDSIRNSLTINNISDVFNNTYDAYLIDSLDIIDSTQYFQFNCAATHQGYQWDFGDGTTSNNQNPLHSYSTPGIYNVCLTTTDNDCSRTLCNKIDASRNPDYSLSFNYSLSQNTVIVSAPSNWENIIWLFSDSTTSNNSSETHIYNPGSVYDICLTASHNGILKTFCRQVSIPESISCNADWYYSSGYNTISSVIPKPVQSKMIMNWIDNNGIKYSSSINNQPSTSYLHILSNENYSNNESDSKTRKLKLEFDLFLFNENNTNDSKRITSSNCVWGVAYP
jgi:hypothetical protein